VRFGPSITRGTHYVMPTTGAKRREARPLSPIYEGKEKLETSKINGGKKELARSVA